VKFNNEDVGKRFIVFLSKGRLVLPGGEVIHPRGEQEFDVSNRYLVLGKEIQADPGFTKTGTRFSYETVISEIQRVAVPQMKLAQGRQ
jgi:hypothetical protein